MRVLYNARIRTQGQTPEETKGITALAIEHGQVLCIGSDAAVLAQAGSAAHKEDLHGQVIWPGLTDAHIHLQHYAFALQMVDCETPTQAECLRRVAGRVAQTPNGAWVRGHGWNQNDWPEGFGTTRELTDISPQHPVYLTAKSLHAGWANQIALQAAGITRNTPDPKGGKIGRFADGEPDGLLFEAAMDLINAAIPTPTNAEVTQALETAQSHLWQFGITGAHDFDQSACFAALQTLQSQGKLRLRVVKSIPVDQLDEAVALGLRSGFGNDYLRIGSVKLFADGALGPQTAAMLQPYAGSSDNTGVLLLDNEQIFEYGQQASAHGISVAIHAIGDRANHEVLLAYQNLRRFEQENHLASLRHRIEHVQLLHPDDFYQLANLNIIASVQPIHATSDMFTADRFWTSRSAGAYAYQMLIQGGTRVCFGSDAPVESPNPFLGLHAAVTRQRTDDSPGEDGWYPQQRLSLEQALHGFTTGPAYAASLENSLGRLLPGYAADLIVLPEDPFAQPFQDLWQIRPVATMIGGEWVWQA